MLIQSMVIEPHQLKRLHLAGCFELGEIYFGNAWRYQKMIIQLLSALVQTTSH